MLGSGDSKLSFGLNLLPRETQGVVFANETTTRITGVSMTTRTFLIVEACVKVGDDYFLLEMKGAHKFVCSIWPVIIKYIPTELEKYRKS